MKKSLIIIGAAILALAACNKEIVESPTIPDNTVSALTFTSARPQLDVDTKTAWDATTSSIIWQSTDKIKVGFTFDGAWWAQTAVYNSEGEAPNNHIKFYQSDAVTIDKDNKDIGTFTVPSTFTGPTTSGSFVFYSVYPAGIVGNSLDTAPSATMTLKTSQEPTEGTFDASTDIMVGTSQSITSTGLPESAINLSWKRVVAHAALTFSNMAFDGTEVPSKITLTFNDDAKVAGSFSVNIADGTIGSGSANEIALEGSGLTASENSVTAWASVLPVTFTSLKVEVKTDKATYTRSITGISKTFKQNARNTLTINMATAERAAAEQYDWVKKDLSKITSSDVFVIVGTASSKNYAMNHTSLNTKGAPNATEVTVSGNKLATSPIEGIQWNLTYDSNNGYQFFPNGVTTKWLNLTADNNGLRVSNSTDNGKYWTLDDSGYLKGTDTKDAARYIGIYSSTDWRSYTSSTATNIKDQTFAFYVRTSPGDEPTLETPTLTFSEPTMTVNVGETVTNAATIDPSSLTVTYNSSNEDVATVDASGTVTGVAIGIATITASFAGDDSYEAISANYQITVVDPNGNDGSAEKPYLASEAAALAIGGSTAEVYVKGIISKITGAYSSDYNNISFAISDNGLESGTQFVIYRAEASSADDFKVGDYIVFKGSLTLYNTTPELAQGNELVSQLHGPTFSVSGGNYSETQSITLTADEGSEIRYTVDGTTPSSSTGSVYSSAIAVSETTTIKAIAIKDGISTGVVSETYTIVSGDSKTATYVFNTDAGLTALGITKPEASAGTELGTNTYTVEDITFSNTSGSTATRVWNTNGSTDLRIYKNGTFVFTTSNGTIKSIVLSGTTVGGFTASSGTFSNGTWSGSATKVTLTATATEKVNTIEVTYE